MEKLGDASLRTWYATHAVANGWSRDTLVAQIERGLHLRAGRAVTNFADRLPPDDSDLAQQLTRDPYVFDFVGNAGTRVERDLERGLVEHLEKFLLELGQGFAFVGRQVRLTVGEDDLFVDLLFYHLRLRCFVVAELKAVPFEPGFTSQLGTYMAIVDDTLRHPDDKPTIGLLICKTKNDVMVEYALHSMSVPIGVSAWAEEFRSQLPEELAVSLPSIEALEADLSDPPDGSP